MRKRYLSTRQNASSMGLRPTHVTMIHPHHPLYGKKLELVRVLRDKNSRLVVRLPEGKNVWIPRDWTDYESSQGNEIVSNPSHLLDIRGLCEMVKIVGGMPRSNSER